MLTVASARVRQNKQRLILTVGIYVEVRTKALLGGQRKVVILRPEQRSRCSSSRLQPSGHENSVRGFAHTREDVAVMLLRRKYVDGTLLS